MNALGSEDRISRIIGDLRPDPPQPGRDEQPSALAERMADCATPAVSLAVVDRSELAFARGFGRLGRNSAAEVTAHTPFQVGSISKPVFALAVMKLVVHGKLDLDADVRTYLRSWQLPAHAGWKARVTLRQLLSHTAGTTVHGFPGYPAAGPWPTLLQVLDGLPPSNTKPIRVDLMPGTQFRYSGGGTTLAQQVVTDVTGRPFPDLMRDLVLEPAGMMDSSFAQPLPAAIAARAARAHPWNGVETPGGWHVYPEMAAAGLWTTAADLGRLGIEILRTLRGDKSRLDLSRDGLTSMLHPQLADQRPGQDFVGLGWFCSGDGADFQFGHQGGNEGFLADLRIFPARKAAVAVMLNSEQGWSLPGELVKAVSREYGLPPGSHSPVAVPMPAGIDYAGAYRGADGATVTIEREAERLLLLFGGQDPIPLLANADGGFFAGSIDLRLRFQGGDKARPTTLTLKTGGKEIKLERAADAGAPDTVSATLRFPWTARATWS
jgi:CubicO group peptidase (beta-lactamase class C family)